MPKTIKVPVSYYHDKQIIQAGEAAELLHIRAQCLSLEQQTDGHLLREQVMMLGLSNWEERVDALCQVGLWECTPTGYQIVNWTHPTAEHIAAVSEQRRKAGSSGGRKSETVSGQDDAPPQFDAIYGELPFSPDWNDPERMAHFMRLNKQYRRPANPFVVQAVLRRLHQNPEIKAEIGRQLTAQDVDDIVSNWLRYGRPIRAESLLPESPTAKAPWGDPWWLVCLVGRAEKKSDEPMRARLPSADEVLAQ